MIPMRPNRLIALFSILLVATSCVSTQLPPISRSGEAFTPLRDERVLWESARDEEEMLLDRVRLYHDPALEEYLEGIVARLNPAGMAANPEIRYRVRVIEDPTLNAFAYPHGSIYVHTGLLARMETEDQVATILAHEMSHVEGRHMLRHQRSARNKQVGLSIAAVAAAVVLAGEAGDAYGKGDWGKGAMIDVLGDLALGLGLQLAVLAAVNGYGRELEREADDGGFAKLAAAGYDVAESPAVYQALLDDHGEPRKLEGFFFGSHPQLTQRIASAKAWMAKHPEARRGEGATSAADGDQGDQPDAFAERLLPVLRDDARRNVEMERYALACEELRRYQALAPRGADVAAVRSSFLELEQAGHCRQASTAGVPAPQVP